ncbi:hypothetical protein BX666DRAFT_841831 [Dichotomocladium elegans]|nr:hypothetical protein BX666DRAFT_841831 [Dichotomocladium elegans]
MSAFRSAFYRQCLPTSLHTVGNRPIQVISRSMAINTTTATLATTGRHRRPARIDRETQYSGFLDIDSAASRAMKSLYRIPADPFVAAKRVEKILEKTTHDDALEYLTHLRVGLQSTAAWNSLLKHCAAQGKSKLAESDYVQMRKRGIEPNQHTHTIMISALGNSKSPHAMAKAEGWLKERIKDGPSVVHYNALLTVYKQHGLSMREAWDRIKSDKSFRPDAITYSILFQCAKPGDESRVRRAWQERKNLGSSSSLMTAAGRRKAILRSTKNWRRISCRRCSGQTSTMRSAQR